MALRVASLHRNDLSGGQALDQAPAAGGSADGAHALAGTSAVRHAPACLPQRTAFKPLLTQGSSSHPHTPGQCSHGIFTGQFPQQPPYAASHRGPRHCHTCDIVEIDQQRPQACAALGLVCVEGKHVHLTQFGAARLEPLCVLCGVLHVCDSVSIHCYVALATVILLPLAHPPNTSQTPRKNTYLLALCVRQRQPHLHRQHPAIRILEQQRHHLCNMCWVLCVWYGCVVCYAFVCRQHPKIPVNDLHVPLIVYEIGDDNHVPPTPSCCKLSRGCTFARLCGLSP